MPRLMVDDTTLFHIYSYFLTYRLYNIYSYFFILIFTGFLRCESPSPKLISAFFVTTWRTPFTLLLFLYRAQLWSIFRSQTEERLFPFVYWFPVLYISRVVQAFPTISRKSKVAQTEEIHCVYWFPVKYVGRIVPAFPTISRKAKMAQTEEIHSVYWFPVKHVSRIVQAFPTISRKAKIAGSQSAVFCEVFLTVWYRKGKTCHWCDGRANIFSSILRYLWYSSLRRKRRIRRN